MKEKLLILSDLWGIDEREWMNEYMFSLKENYDIILYDSPKLAGIDIINKSEGNIHKQFIDFGIDKAVEKLLAKEKKEINVLALSIG